MTEAHEQQQQQQQVESKSMQEPVPATESPEVDHPLITTARTAAVNERAELAKVRRVLPVVMADACAMHWRQVLKRRMAPEDATRKWATIKSSLSVFRNRVGAVVERLLKQLTILDTVETQGKPELRAARKAAVVEAQRVMDEADALSARVTKLFGLLEHLMKPVARRQTRANSDDINMFPLTTEPTGVSIPVRVHPSAHVASDDEDISMHEDPHPHVFHNHVRHIPVTTPAAPPVPPAAAASRQTRPVPRGGLSAAHQPPALPVMPLEELARKRRPRRGPTHHQRNRGGHGRLYPDRSPIFPTRHSMHGDMDDFAGFGFGGAPFVLL